MKHLMFTSLHSHKNYLQCIVTVDTTKTITQIQSLSGILYVYSTSQNTKMLADSKTLSYSLTNDEGNKYCHRNHHVWVGQSSTMNLFARQCCIQ